MSKVTLVIDTRLNASLLVSHLLAVPLLLQDKDGRLEGRGRQGIPMVLSVLDADVVLKLINPDDVGVVIQSLEVLGNVTLQDGVGGSVEVARDQGIYHDVCGRVEAGVGRRVGAQSLGRDVPLARGEEDGSGSRDSLDGEVLWRWGPDPRDIVIVIGLGAGWANAMVGVRPLLLDEEVKGVLERGGSGDPAGFSESLVGFVDVVHNEVQVPDDAGLGEADDDVFEPDEAGNVGLVQDSAGLISWISRVGRVVHGDNSGGHGGPVGVLYRQLVGCFCIGSW